MKSTSSDQLKKLIDEQESFSFNGRVNFLEKISKKILGYFYFKSGTIFHVVFAGEKGEAALYRMAQFFEDKVSFDIVSEPEIVENIETNWRSSNSRLGQCLEVFQLEYRKMRNLKPPMEHRLAISPDFVVSTQEILPNEFDVLCAVSDYHVVKDIYKHAPILEYEVTKALVSLRKKGALKVLE